MGMLLALQIGICKKEEDGLRDTSPQGKQFFHMKQHEDRQYQVKAYRGVIPLSLQPPPVPRRSHSLHSLSASHTTEGVS